jgi:hypothetical protein
MQKDMQSKLSKKIYNLSGYLFLSQSAPGSFRTPLARIARPCAGKSGSFSSVVLYRKGDLGVF